MSSAPPLIMDSFKQPLQSLRGVVERITYHNESNGWSVLKVSPYDGGAEVTVTVSQVSVFAGSTLEFKGTWRHHPKYGKQFQASQVIEKKPATAAALEKYLGSGLISGVGPFTAKKIVGHFKERTLEVFEKSIHELLGVPGIARKRLHQISESWQHHRAISDVMIFLQSHNISTLFAVRIYKRYGNESIQVVNENPYRLSRDIYGIGFLSADRVALSIGFKRDGTERIEAAIRHILSSSRDEGHCYLTCQQIVEQVESLLELSCRNIILDGLKDLTVRGDIKARKLAWLSNNSTAQSPLDCMGYYSNSVYRDESDTAAILLNLSLQGVKVHLEQIHQWLCKCGSSLSQEQHEGIINIVQRRFSILTGGPGCGKTTTTKTLVQLLKSLKKSILLAAPTGRAAQRLEEVVGMPASTIHRMLAWDPTKNNFKKNKEDPLNADFLIVDECSMLDINLCAALLRSIGGRCQVLFVGDPDQLPAVGPGNVLRDLLRSHRMSHFRLTKIFRQAEKSHIIRFAHQINKGETPHVNTPIGSPERWRDTDCLFVDAEEATQEELAFIRKARVFLKQNPQPLESSSLLESSCPLKSLAVLGTQSAETTENLNADLGFRNGWIIPPKFLHVDLQTLSLAQSEIEEIRAVLKTVHPHSVLNFGMTGIQALLRLYMKTIPNLMGQSCEIQVLSPQNRGTLGTLNLNHQLQQAVNPAGENKPQLKVGDRIFRRGDRVIQTRNNYDLNVYNGEIGFISHIAVADQKCIVTYPGAGRNLTYEVNDLIDLSLAYAITIHKSQGSEFPVVIIPLATQHFRMLSRNLLYTGLTRARKLAIFVGTRKAFYFSVKNQLSQKRQTALTELLGAPLSL